MSPFFLRRRAACVGGASGFSLVEVSVAVAVIAVATAAIAPTLVALTHGVASARRQTLAIASAVSRMEQLHALTYEADAATGGYRSDVSTNLAEDPPGVDGRGLTPDEGVATWVPRRGLIDFVGDDGLPAEAVGRRVAVRRWSVSGVAGLPAADALLFHVFARARVLEARAGTRPGPDARAEDVWLFTMRVRDLR
jgi:prepilin-type N-terminal cleavage/methylation domain-containing protein